MMLTTIEDLEDIKSSDLYQNQLKAVYQMIDRQGYEQLSVLIDCNAYGDDVLELLPHYQALAPKPIKRMHHTFEHDLVIVDIVIQRIQGQRQLEQLLAIAVFENTNDVAGYAMARSVCLWLFNQPVTTKLKESLYRLGQAIDNQSHKQRYLRYWDPRVLALLQHIWTDKQQLKIKALGFDAVYYVDWNNELVWFDLPETTQVLKTVDDKMAFENMCQPPFRFTDNQWALLSQIEWMNMVMRQLKAQIEIDIMKYSILIEAATLVTRGTLNQATAVNYISNHL